MDAFKREMPVKCPITYIYNPCDIDAEYVDYDAESKTIITAGHFFYGNEEYYHDFDVFLQEKRFITKILSELYKTGMGEYWVFPISKSY